MSRKRKAIDKSPWRTTYEAVRQAHGAGKAWFGDSYDRCSSYFRWSRYWRWDSAFEKGAEFRNLLVLIRCSVRCFGCKYIPIYYDDANHTAKSTYCIYGVDENSASIHSGRSGNRRKNKLEELVMHKKTFLVRCKCICTWVRIGTQAACIWWKSNKITAIPQLLKTLKIKGCLLKIDAMGTQTEIAKKIRKKNADYILLLKSNQLNLYDDVKLFID